MNRWHLLRFALVVAAFTVGIVRGGPSHDPLISNEAGIRELLTSFRGLLLFFSITIVGMSTARFNPFGRRMEWILPRWSINPFNVIGCFHLIFWTSFSFVCGYALTLVGNGRVIGAMNVLMLGAGPILGFKISLYLYHSRFLSPLPAVVDAGSRLRNLIPCRQAIMYCLYETLIMIGFVEMMSLARPEHHWYWYGVMFMFLQGAVLTLVIWIAFIGTVWILGVVLFVVGLRSASTDLLR